jgi:transcriptional regulator with XRE-family HTH domain
MNFYENLSCFIEKSLMEATKAEDIIKQAREEKGLTQMQVAESLGVGLRSYQFFEAGRFPKNKVAQVVQLESVLGIDIYDMVYGGTTNVSHEAQNIVNEPDTYLEKRLKQKNGHSKENKIPMYFGNTRAGTIEVYSDDPEMNKPVGHLPASIFPGCNHGERVSGDSMYPLICNQAYVIGRVIDKKGIIWGEKYIVHTKYGQAMVKYIHPSEKGSDHIKIVSHSKQVPSQDIPLDEITFVCRVNYIVNPS